MLRDELAPRRDERGSWSPLIDLVRRTVRPGSRVLVVSRGDESLVRYDHVHATHFPQGDDGEYAGFHPGSSDDAIAHLEQLRAVGAEYLVFPSSSLWWLEFYDDLRSHLDRRYAVTAYARDVGLVYDVSGRLVGGEVVASPDMPGVSLGKRAPRRGHRRRSRLELTREGDVVVDATLDRGGVHLVRGTLVGTDERSPRAALASVRYLDESGSELPGPHPYLHRSERDDIGWYRYIATTGTTPSPFWLALDPPESATRLEVTLRKWDRRLEDRLFLTAPPSVDAVSAADLADEARRTPDDIELLRLLARLHAREGSLTAQVSMLQGLVERTDAPADRSALALAAGKLRELDVRWVPSLPGATALPARGGAIRICHLFKVSYPFESSGGAIRNLNTVRSQRDAGLDPYVVTPLGYPAPDDAVDVAAEETIAGVPHVRLAMPGDVGALPVDRRTAFDTAATAAIVRARGADVIHAASGFRGYELALKGLALARHFDLPLVYEARSLHEHLWGPGGNDLATEWTQLRIAQENRCMNEADVVVTLASSMRDLFVARGVAAEKIVVIPNAVDVSHFTPVPTDRSLKRRLGLGDGAVVGYISNISRREGHADLLRAFAAIARERPDVSCLVVGDGPDRAGLESLAASMGIAGRTVFTGEIDHADVVRYYSIIDVFVVPRLADYASDHVTPLKPFEALALERAMIVSDRPSLREIVGEDERFGLIYRSGDVDHLAVRIRQLLDHPQLRMELGHRGRRWIAAERTWDANARRYRELYEGLLSRRPAR